jgi:hypothetical protein
VYGGSDYEALTYLSRQYDTFASSGGVEGRFINPLANLKDRKRIGYQRVYSLGLSPESEENVDGIRLDELYTRLVRGTDPDRERQLIAALSEATQWTTPILPGEILVDIPLKPRLRWARMRDTGDSTGTVAEVSERRQPLWIRERALGTGHTLRWRTLQQYSPIAKAFAAVEDVSGRKIRVFFARDLLTRIPEGIRDRAYSIVQGTLWSATTDWMTTVTHP